METITFGNSNFLMNNWLTFSNKERLFLANFRNNIYAIGYPMQIRAYMEEPEIVVPYCKMYSNYGATTFIHVVHQHGFGVERPNSRDSCHSSGVRIVDEAVVKFVLMMITSHFYVCSSKQHLAGFQAHCQIWRIAERLQFFVYATWTALELE